MITVIRINNLGEGKPAGEVFTFPPDQECQSCCNFLWGKDIKNYLVFRNGYPVELDSDLYEFERRLEEYG